MPEKRWALIKASEDGNPITWLDSDDLDDVLTNPSDWGVVNFAHPDLLADDPNYWPAKTAVLLRYEVVVPEPAGVYKLPAGLDE